VAFDIRFEYELSDGTKVELQPKENTVQVTFDYSWNSDLKKADKADDQQIEIYHINDKDENGEKVEDGEEVVEKIEINEEKSDEVKNGVVVDAESFSVYAVVVNTHNYNIILSDTYETAYII
jgi:Fe-S cluster assembly scaffold protein SufB